MAQQTFSQVWQKFLLYAPGVPVPLAQQFVKNAYNRALNSHSFSELIKEGEKVIRDTYSTGTIAVTNGSAAVTGTLTVWTAAMSGMQLRIDDNDGIPFYTFTRTGATTGTLDRNYEGPTDTSSTYSLQELYVDFPTDLDSLDDIRDANQSWRLRRQHYQQNYLDFVDAKRENSGSPCMYVAAPPTVASGVSTPRFEFWPSIESGTHIVYRYTRTHELSANSDYLITMLLPEAVLYGALADLCIWPGHNRDNPYFDMELHKKYTELADDAIHDSEMADLERSQRMIIPLDGAEGFPTDASFWQAHGIVPD